MLAPFASFLQAYQPLESAALQRWLRAHQGRVDALFSPLNAEQEQEQQQQGTQPPMMVPLSSFAEGVLGEEARAVFPVARAMVDRAEEFSHGWVTSGSGVYI